MKVRIKATGEIINIAEYAKVTLDRCDSFGDPIQLPFDEVEIISEPKTEEVKESSEYLVDPSGMPSENRMRYELTKAAISTACKKLIASNRLNINNNEIAFQSVNIADAILNKLRKQNE